MLVQLTHRAKGESEEEKEREKGKREKKCRLAFTRLSDLSKAILCTHEYIKKG